MNHRLSPAATSDMLLVVVTFVAAISWMFSKEAVLLMPPILFMSVRFLLAALCLLCFSASHLRNLSLPLLKRSLWVGMFFGGAMTSWVMGLAQGDAMGEGAFLTSLGVVFVPVVSRVFFQESPPFATWLALPVALAGLGLLTLPHGFRITPSQGYFLLAAALFACFYTLNTRATRPNNSTQQEAVHPLAMTTVLMFVATVVTGLASWHWEARQWPSVTTSAALTLWVLLSAVVGTAMRFLLQTYAQSLTHSTNGAVILILEPLWVAMLSVLWFQESLSPVQWLGCSVILAALIINRWQAIVLGIKTWKR